MPLPCVTTDFLNVNSPGPIVRPISNSQTTGSEVSLGKCLCHFYFECSLGGCSTRNCFHITGLCKPARSYFWRSQLITKKLEKGHAQFQLQLQLLPRALMQLEKLKPRWGIPLTFTSLVPKEVVSWNVRKVCRCYLVRICYLPSCIDQNLCLEICIALSKLWWNIGKNRT